MLRRPAWMNTTVVAIVAATFLSDVGHEMATAVLPLYLTSVGLGAAALGVMEGVADLLFSLAKLSGGVVGHHVERKRPLVALGYLVTAVGTASMGLVHSVTALAGVRGAAWIGRGFRSPLRDFLLSDAVEPSHFGRAYGVERSADMLGAVVGPLVAAALLALHVDLRTVILVSFLPSLGAVLAVALGARDNPRGVAKAAGPKARIPPAFWLLFVGVVLFGLGDFSRTFLILLLGRAMSGAAEGAALTAALPYAALVYALHNGVSAVAAIPAGRAADRRSKLAVLLVGYGIGVGTNALLAVGAGSTSLLLVAVGFSGVYIAIEETVEKATAAELLPREVRSLGFGILACGNAVGDMLSSLYTGLMLDRGEVRLAFGVPAACGLAGVLWLLVVRRRIVAAAAT